MISYAQNFEDIMLWRALKNIKNGCYIDVGAFNPESDSVTKWFYDNGWSGVNIDPIVECYDLFVKNRPLDINLNVFVSDIKGEIEFYENAATGLSTGEIKNAKACQVEHAVSFEKCIKQTTTLDSICDEYSIKNVHFLKIDVEGFENRVLRGFSFDKVRPWVVLFEAVEPTGDHADVSADCVEYLRLKNYHQVYFDGLNKFFVADEHKDLDKAFFAPLNIFDQSSIQLNGNHWILAPKIMRYEEVIMQKEKELNENRIELDEKNKELKFIKSSKFWKLRSLYLKYISNAVPDASIQRAADTWNSIDIDKVRTVAWSSIKLIQNEIRNNFSGEMSPASYVHKILVGRVKGDDKNHLIGAAIACGDMSSERKFFEKDEFVDFESVDGFDISDVSLDRNNSDINFYPHITDCNNIVLENNKYDLIVGSHGIHHLMNLDNVFHQMNKGLKKNGIVYLCEWVGPNYLQIPLMNRIVSILILVLFFSPKVRKNHMGIRKGLFWLQQRPREFDPSEACNSVELYPKLIKYFNPINVIKYGGLSYPIFEGISQNIDQSLESNIKKIKIIYHIEDFLTRHGIIKPLFMLAIAEKKEIKI